MKIKNLPFQLNTLEELKRKLEQTERAERTARTRKGWKPGQIERLGFSAQYCPDDIWAGCRVSECVTYRPKGSGFTEAMDGNFSRFVPRRY